MSGCVLLMWVLTFKIQTFRISGFQDSSFGKQRLMLVHGRASQAFKCTNPPACWSPALPLSCWARLVCKSVHPQG